jgi:hypothetical protein
MSLHTDLDVRWTAVGDDPSQSAKLRNGHGGLWAVKDSRWIQRREFRSINVTPLLEIVSDWIDGIETIDLFKIDVEGGRDGRVAHSAVPLFAANRYLGYVYAGAPPGEQSRLRLSISFWKRSEEFTRLDAFAA